MSQHTASQQTQRPRPTESRDVAIQIVLGDATVDRQQIAALEAGSVVALRQLVDEPVEIHSAGKTIALGQVVALDNKLCVRVTELLDAHANVFLGTPNESPSIKRY